MAQFIRQNVDEKTRNHLMLICVQNNIHFSFVDRGQGRFDVCIHMRENQFKKLEDHG